MSFHLMLMVAACPFFGSARTILATNTSASRCESHPRQETRPPKRCPVWWGDFGTRAKAKTPTASQRGGKEVSSVLNTHEEFQVPLTYLWWRHHI